MSDTFDHEGDAWASLDSWEEGDGSPWRSYGRRRSSSTPFVPDRLHYHTLLTFKELKAETPKAYLLVFRGKEVWVPKKICRGFSESSKTVYVHAQTIANILNSR